MDMKIIIEQDSNSKYLIVNKEKKLNYLIQMDKAKPVSVIVKDPLLRDIKADYLILVDGRSAIIKLNSASGLSLLKEDEINPLHTTSLGTGELILHALDQGCREFYIGLGGSSTMDCGAGILYALGVRFFDKNNEPIQLTGSGINKMERLDTSKMDSRIKESNFTIITNRDEEQYVSIGSAAFIEGAEIGATKLMMEALERGLYKFNYVVRNQLGKDMDSISGAGIAGGIAGSIMVFLNGKIEKSIELDI